MLWPSPPAVSAGEMLSVRLACAALSAAAAAACHLVRVGHKRIWMAAGLLSAGIGASALFVHLQAVDACVASYVGTPTIIGRDYTPLTIENIRTGVSQPNAELLLEDAGGNVSDIWTSESIGRCRVRVTWSALLPIPFFAMAAGALIAAGRRRFALAPPVPVGAAAAGAAAAAVVYDAFISYRHVEPDRANALEVVQSLEARGLRVAIDYRDFSPNEHFLTEIERCIRTSRFVLCLVTSSYLASDHTSAEAIISKTLDLAERRKRLVPLLFERIELPVWLWGLSGIDCTPAAGIDPIDRLLALLLPGRIGT
jgi:hypothetical protein